MHPLRHLNKYLYKYRLRLIAGFLFIIIYNLFGIFPAQVVRHALDLLAENITVYQQMNGFSSQSSFRSDIVMTAFLFGVMIVVLTMLKGVFLFFTRQTIIVMSRLIEYDLKNEIFEHYQDLSVSFYRRNNTGDLMARISEDVSRVRNYLGPGIMYTLNLLVLSVLVISTMVSVNLKLTILVLLPLPVLGISIYLVSSLIETKSDQVQSQLSALSTYVQEAFSGIRVLKSFVREEFSVTEFAHESEAYKNKSLELARINALFFPIMLVLVGMSTLLTIFIGGIEVMAGRATFGTIAEFIYYVNMLTWPFASVGWVTSLVQRAAASQSRINEFLHTKPDIISKVNESKEFGGTIEFRNVGFVYPDTGIQALKNVSFVLEKGQSLAIVGKTGCGKSTVANLLLRLFDVTEGEILIDGRNIKDFSINTLRENIGYVPQDVFLFSDTIENNISFGIKQNSASRQQIEQAAQDASVLSNILEFPEGFETLIGERGITLSGGQKQRISIARAIIKSPKILVFDDCLSAVDTQTEEAILDSLRRVMHTKTTLIISHRVSTVKQAAYILVMEQGEVVEQGTREQLLGENGFYRKMYDMQLLEEETQAS